MPSGFAVGPEVRGRAAGLSASGLSFKGLGRNADAIKAFETAATIKPEDYFRDLEEVDEASLDERLLEVRPQLIAASNSAVHFRELNKSLSASETKKWVQRQSELYDFAALVTASEVTKPARVSRSPFPSRTFSGAQANYKLSGNATFVMFLPASGKSRLLLTKGYMPQEVLPFYLDDIARIEFVPATSEGRAVSRFLVWTRTAAGQKGDH